MNNPYNLSPAKRGITPRPTFGEGINRMMPKAKRAKKQARSRRNNEMRAALHKEKAARRGSMSDRASIQARLDLIGAGKQVQK